ncbi:MAG: hypothetical protein OXF75_00065 [Acidimicrobiaceae bacterium]|nr:hypothetical protein [Acidimicrobiaceae bacterium]
MSAPVRPNSLYDREAEWEDLSRFAASVSGLRLGIVYGRRRFGKSFLLRRLVEAMDGVYHLALREERRPALERFAGSLRRQLQWAPLQPFRDWTDALEQAVGVLGARGTRPQLLVIDEYPHLSQNNPDLDSAIQALMDEAAAGRLAERWTAPVGVVLCGSAMSVMTQILSGASPMRGRASLDMALAAFDYRQARGYWGIDDLRAAFAIDTVVGGAAGYKDLTSDAGIPESSDDLPAWLAATVLNPSHALFREDEYLLREDPRVTGEAVYYSVLGAVADGRTTPTKIAEALGRTPNDISHHLGVMTTAGFVVRHEDLLADRRPQYRVADPIVRFHHLVNRRHRARLEDRRGPEVWAEAEAAYRAGIAGPHFESMCRLWTDRYASEATLGSPAGPSASLQVNDRRARQSFELDVVALRRGSHAGGVKTVQLIGEAKVRQLDIGALERLDRLGDILAGRSGVILSPSAKRLLFSARGFTPALVAAAGTRRDVELVDLARLYEGN